MDVFLIHGKIWLGEARFCDAMVIRQGRVATVGTETALAHAAAGCRVLDCGWRTVIPGLFEPYVRMEKACGPLPFSRRHRKEGFRRWLQTAAREGVTVLQSADLGGGVKKEDLPILEQLYREDKHLPRLQFLLPENWPPLKGWRPEDRPPGFGGRMLSVENLWQTRCRGRQRWVSVPDRETLEAVLEQLRRYPLPEGNPRRLTLLDVPCTDSGQLRELGAAAVDAVVFPGRLADSLAACAGQPGAHPDTCCAWRTLSHLGAKVAFAGGDRLAPFAGLQKAVCRRQVLPDGRERPSPEALTVEEALLAMTSVAARTDFREDSTGRLAPGYRADLLVLDRDVFTCDRQLLSQVRPVLTMSGGRVIWTEIFH
ncbi:MAG: amidohydrolase family protein [Clostridia bacterium]|nr:amidohydrolase family protein [Clostridia bacterium]